LLGRRQALRAEVLMGAVKLQNELLCDLGGRKKGRAGRHFVAEKRNSGHAGPMESSALSYAKAAALVTALRTQGETRGEKPFAVLSV
jgi:hypothetical protein